MPKLSCLIICFLLVGCAAKTVSKQELFPAEFAQKKECWTYDTTRENMSRNSAASALGIFGPIGLIGTLVAAGIDAANLPVKCGLTIEDVIKNSYVTAYQQDTNVTYNLKRQDIKALIRTRHDGREKDCIYCSMHIETDFGAGAKDHDNNMMICQDPEGMPAIHRENIDEKEYDTVTAQYRPVSPMDGKSLNLQPQ